MYIGIDNTIKTKLYFNPSVKLEFVTKFRKMELKSKPYMKTLNTFKKKS